MSSGPSSDHPERLSGTVRSSTSFQDSETSPTTTSSFHQHQLPARPGPSRQRSRSSSNDSESPGRTTRHQRARSDEGISDRSSEEAERRDSLPLQGSQVEVEGGELRRHQGGGLIGSNSSQSSNAGPSRRPRQPQRQQSMPLLRLTRALSPSSTSQVSFERTSSSRPPPSFASTGDAMRDDRARASPSSSPNWTFSQPSGSAFDWRTSHHPSRPNTSGPTPSPTSVTSFAPESSRQPNPPIARLPRRGSRAQLLGTEAERAASRPRSHSLGTALLGQLGQEGQDLLASEPRSNSYSYSSRSRATNPPTSNPVASDSSSTLPSNSTRAPFVVPTVPSSGLRSPLQLLATSPNLIPSGMTTQESRTLSPIAPIGAPSSSPVPSPIERVTQTPMSNNSKGFSFVKDGRRYKLVVVQNSVRARMCGFGDKNRRPLSPAPVVKLQVFNEATGEELDPTEVQTSLFVVTAELRQPDGSPLETNLSSTATSQLPRRSVGSVASTSASSLPTSPSSISPVISPSISTAAGVSVPAISRNSSQSPLEPISVSTSRTRSSSDALFPSLSAATSNASQTEQVVARVNRPRSGTVINPSTRFGLLRSGSAGNASSRALSSGQASSSSSSAQALPTSTSAPVGGLVATAAAGTVDRRRSSGEGSDPSTSTTFMRNLVGVTVASANVLRDENEQTGIFFALHDVSVRLEGVYCLKLTMTDLRLGGRVNEGISESLAETFTEPFTVYPPRRFPGMLEPTALSRKLASQGVKIPVRTDKKKKRRASEEEDDEAEEENE